MSSRERLLGLKFSPDVKWGSYIGFIAKDVEKMVDPLSRKYLTTPVILKFYTNQTKLKMDYCFHSWAGAVQSFLSSLDSVQKRLRLRGLVGDDLFPTLHPLPNRRNAVSLSIPW